MGENSKIEWTDCTDNIIVVKGGGWWCRKISPGCENCYAAALNQSSYFGGNKLDYTGQPPELELRRDILAKWARQTRPRKHFVASMTDVFGDWVPREWVFEMLDAMTNAPRQTFQVLTKRPDVARAHIMAWLETTTEGWRQLPDNIWIGTTVEDQTRADQRIPELMSIPARVRFLSCEPLLSRLRLQLVASHADCEDCRGTGYYGDNGPGRKGNSEWIECDAKRPRIHWVIAGGESGRMARPMQPAWLRGVRDQCTAAGVPFFFKQWGEWAPCRPEQCFANGADIGMRRIGKKEAGRLLDGREWSEFPTTS